MIKRIILYFKESFYRKTFLQATGTSLVSICLGIYNLFISNKSSTLFNKCIAGYYFLLVAIRVLILLFEFYSNKHQSNRLRIIAYYITSSLLLVLSLALITPVSLMVLDKRDYKYSLVHSIFLAVITFYSLILAIINIIKSSKNDNILVKQARLVTIITVGVSLLTLQNTLIISNGGFDNSMQILSLYTSIGVVITIWVISIISFRRCKFIIKNLQN